MYITDEMRAALDDELTTGFGADAIESGIEAIESRDALLDALRRFLDFQDLEDEFLRDLDPELASAYRAQFDMPEPRDMSDAFRTMFPDEMEDEP